MGPITQAFSVEVAITFFKLGIKKASRFIDKKKIERALETYKNKDFGTAFKNIEKLAIKKDNSTAQLVLGIFYYEGKAVDKNTFEAVKWWRKSANKDNRDAKFFLGCCYMKGEGVTENTSTGIDLIQQAAELGHVQSAFLLGCKAYSEGKQEHAEYWFLQIEKGYLEANYYLGLLYFKYDEDDKRAKKYYELVARKNLKDVQYIADAQCELGCIYRDGKNILINKIMAHAWFSIASDNGSEKAEEALGELESILSIQEIERAEQKAIDLGKEFLESD